MEIDGKILELFGKYPDALPLWVAVDQKLEDAFGPLAKKVGSSMVSYRARYAFAWLWPPFRRVKGWPKVFLGLSFGLDEKIDSPRLAEVANPYPNRYTHHFIVARPEDVDDEVMDWLRRAYAFGNRGK